MIRSIAFHLLYWKNTFIVVGAGSVVHGTFPDNCIIAGNPAKIIKHLKQE